MEHIGLRLLALCVAWLVFRTPALSQTRPVVHTSPGDLRGVIEAGPGGQKIGVFRGVPYALPPVGDKRWRRPEPARPWTRVRDARVFSPACAQAKQGWNDRFAAESSEDCLYLNIWSTAAVNGPAHQVLLPVLVYIHGGSNQAGTASEDLSNGLSLAPRGVVLVTLNYRVGVFGFFSSKALRQEAAAGGVSGNYGLSDQIAALQWVQREIRAFGGDPRRVTIMGQSAGAIDVGALMTSPLAHGLFAGAIEESGTVTGLLPPATAAASEQAWAGVQARLGEDLHSLRMRSTAEVLEADRSAPRAPAVGRGLSLDGRVLTESPSAVFAAGREAAVPLLLGSNLQEIVPQGQSSDATRQQIEAALPPGDASSLEQEYGLRAASPAPSTVQGETSGSAAARWATDSMFRCPARLAARQHSTRGLSTFEYQFDGALPWQPSALHSSELFFVFHYFHAQHGETGEWTDGMEHLSEQVERYWTNFVKSGDPNRPDAAALVPWPEFKRGDEAFLEFTPAGPASGTRLGDPACSLILAEPAIRQHPGN